MISPDATELVQAMTAEQAQFGATSGRTGPLQSATRTALSMAGKAKRNRLEDRRLAFRALAVGDTVLLGTAYLQRSQRTTRPPDSVETSTDGQPRVG